MKKLMAIALLLSTCLSHSSNVPRLDRNDVKNTQKVYKAEDFDFRLKPNSAAVDRGMPLPNVNDGFTGRAPDLGALEVGKAVPHYGPRF